MARLVAVLGSKGGTGKSSLAHLIGHGAGSLARQVPCVVVTTDPGDSLAEGRRRYAVADGRTPRQLVEQLERLLPVERLLVVVDGSAARLDLDERLAPAADLVLVPFGPSLQDATRAAADLDRLPASAVGLPNRWPTHPGVRRRAGQWLGLVPEPRRLPPFPAMPRLDGLLSAEGYDWAAYDLAHAARGLLLEVLARGGIDPGELAHGDAELHGAVARPAPVTQDRPSNRRRRIAAEP